MRAGFVPTTSTVGTVKVNFDYILLTVPERVLIGSLIQPPSFKPTSVPVDPENKVLLQMDSVVKLICGRHTNKRRQLNWDDITRRKCETILLSNRKMRSFKLLFWKIHKKRCCFHCQYKPVPKDEGFEKVSPFLCWLKKKKKPIWTVDWPKLRFHKQDFKGTRVMMISGE